MKKLCALCSIIIVTLLSLTACQIGEAETTTITTGQSQTNTSTLDIPETTDSFSGFYRTSSEIEALLEEIVFADPRIQELIKDHDHVFIINSNQIKHQDYHLNVGAFLKEDISGAFQGWLSSDGTDLSLVDEFVGVLQIGYSVKYNMTIDIGTRRILDLTKVANYGGRIPELTKEEMERGLSIALSDSRLVELLEGKSYEIAPENRLGVWHTSEDLIKLGLGFEIRFDIPYFIDYNWPRLEYDEDSAKFPPYGESTYHWAGEVEALSIKVNLIEDKLVSITPLAS